MTMKRRVEAEPKCAVVGTGKPNSAASQEQLLSHAEMTMKKRVEVASSEEYAVLGDGDTPPETLRELLLEVLWSSLMASRTTSGSCIDIGKHLLKLLPAELLAMCLRAASCQQLPASLVRQIALELPTLHVALEQAKEEGPSVAAHHLLSVV